MYSALSPFVRNRRGPRTVLAGCTLLVLAVHANQPARGTLFTLLGGNSRFEINTQSQALAYEWWVDGKQHLTELSNWYRISRIGNTNVSNPETSAHTLPIVNEYYNGSNSMTVEYSDNDLFKMDITFTLLGGAWNSGYSSMGECVRITNITDTTRPIAELLGFHFYEYLDLDLDETPNDDEVAFVNPSLVRQVDLTSGTVFTGHFGADRYELAFYNSTLNKLTDNAASNLSHLASNWPLGAGPVGPANPPLFDPPNVTWAAQFDFTGTNPPRPFILPGQTVEICKICEIQMLFVVPEPASGTIAVLGIAALLVVRRTRRKSLTPRLVELRRVVLPAICIGAAWLTGPTTSANAVTVTFKDGINVVSSDNAINIPLYSGTEDTSINAFVPSAYNNYGGHIDLLIGEAQPMDDMAILIRFDVGALAGKYQKINSINLRLFKYDDMLPPNTDRRVDVHVVDTADADWVEGTVATLQGAPEPGSASYNERQHANGTPWNGSNTLALSGFAMATGPSYQNMVLNSALIDFTDLIDTWIAPGKNAGLRIAITDPTAGPRKFDFASRDNPTLVEARPELVIDYTPIPEPTSLGLAATAICFAGRIRRGRWA